MQNPISLKSLEKQAFRATYADGLWDVFIGCFALQFALAPLLSVPLGDFWSSAIFLPFWAGIYLVIWLARKHLVAPRLGNVSFRKARQIKIARLTMMMLVVNVLVALLGILTALYFSSAPNTASQNQVGFVISLVFGLFLLAGFGLAAYLLDFTRLYVYGWLLFAAPLVGEWLYQFQGATHHGYPIVFGFVAALMILTGLTHFFFLLKTHPLPEEA